MVCVFFFFGGSLFINGIIVDGIGGSYRCVYDISVCLLIVVVVVDVVIEYNRGTKSRETIVGP